MELTGTYTPVIITYSGHNIIYYHKDVEVEEVEDVEDLEKVEVNVNKEIDESEGEVYIDRDEEVSITDTYSQDEYLVGEKHFEDNLDFIDEVTTDDLYIIDECDDVSSMYEIIDESSFKPINNRYRKQTWSEYFRKLYMVTVILFISIVIYFYYYYSKRKQNVVSKL